MPLWPIVLLIVAIFCAVVGFPMGGPLGMALQVVFWLIILFFVVMMILTWRSPPKR